MITDDYMREVINGRRQYTLVVFKNGPKANEIGADKLIWEHGRRNLKLRKDGMLDLIIGLRDDWEVIGMDVFNTNVDETRRIMEDDPAVKAGVLTYEIHPTVSFPGDVLSDQNRLAHER
jgi:hypothetical protein